MFKDKKQISPWDCSLYVFREYLSYKKYEDIPLDELKFKAKYNQEGISLNNYNMLLNEFGYSINAYKASIEEISKLSSNELPFGAIISSGNYNHMILIIKIDPKYITYYDPGLGTKTKISTAEFAELTKGIYIEFLKDTTLVNHTSVTIKEQGNNKDTNYSLFLLSKTKIILLFVLLFELGIYIIIPWINKRILNIIIPYKLKDEIIIIALLIFISFLFIYLIQTLSYQIRRNYFYNYSYQKLFATLEKFSKENYGMLNIMPNVEIKTRLGNLFYILNIQEVFLPNFIVNCVGFCVSLLILRNINLVLLLILCCFGILILVISYLKKIIYEKNYLKIQGNSYHLETKLDNYLKSLKEAQEDYLTKRILFDWQTNSKTFKDKSLSFEIHNNNLNSFQNTIEMSLHLFISIIGVYEIWNQRMEYSNFIYFLTSINLFIRPIKGFFQSFDSYIEYSQKIKTIDIFDKNTKNQLTIPKFNETIKSLQLSYAEFKYQDLLPTIVNIDRLILQDKVKIIGKNGKGKSTIAKLLAGLLPLNKGEIFVNEKISYLFFNERLKEQILYLNSERSDLHLAVKDYLIINDKNSFIDLLKNSNLDVILKSVNLDLSCFLDKQVNSLSKGQLAFIKLLKLFLRDYDVIIFDEAFENLSINTYNDLKNRLNSLLSNKLVIEISHSSRYIFDGNSNEVNLDELV